MAKRTKEKVITFIIGSDLDELIEASAKRRGMLKRAVINEALESHFRKTQ